MPAPTACKRTVSGTISLPLRGTFHLSLTVLVHYRSPLLRESRFLSFPRVTKMFQFTRLPHLPYLIQASVRAHYHAWVSPFGDPGVKGWSAPHPGLSQPPTSFIGSWRQGIHRVPLVS